MRVVAQVSVAMLVPQEKHYRDYWKNVDQRNTRGKVLVLTMGTPVAEPLLAMKHVCSSDILSSIIAYMVDKF